MKEWARSVGSWNMQFILKCVDNDAWQAFRRSMKGVSTEEKLDMLEDYVRTHEVAGTYDIVEQCRIDNYINALLRGGQLKRIENIIKVQR